MDGQWSMFEENHGLPPYIRELIDDPSFERSVLRGLRDEVEGRTHTLGELINLSTYSERRPPAARHD